MHVSQSQSGFHVWPQSKLGAIGVALTVLFLVILGLNLWTSGDGDQNSSLVFATFLGALCALAGLFFVAVAIIRLHERSLLAFLPVVIGVLVIAFIAVEIFVGHD
jgi:uncharacterized membrane protein